MLVTLVSYCSREREFADEVIENARMFSDLVVVSIGTRLYTGEDEDVESETRRIIRDVDQGGCGVVCTVYDVPHHLLGEPVVLHNRSRQVGLSAAKRVVGSAPFWTLFLDGDEVPDGPRTKEWWNGPSGEDVRRDPRKMHKMANYWMFLHRKLQAEVHEDSVLLAHTDMLAHEACLSHPRERDGIYLWHMESPLGVRDLVVERLVKGDDGSPLFRHYSWVRSGSDGGRAAIKGKCKNWGHRGDRDWDALIDEAFDGIERGEWPDRDFVHSYPLHFV
jgi:hypothetical protein